MMESYNSCPVGTTGRAVFCVCCILLIIAEMALKRNIRQMGVWAVRCKKPHPLTPSPTFRFPLLKTWRPTRRGGMCMFCFTLCSFPYGLRRISGQTTVAENALRAVTAETHDESRVIPVENAAI